MQRLCLLHFRVEVHAFRVGVVQRWEAMQIYRYIYIYIFIYIIYIFIHIYIYM